MTKFSELIEAWQKRELRHNNNFETFWDFRQKSWRRIFVFVLGHQYRQKLSDDLSPSWNRQSASKLKSNEDLRRSFPSGRECFLWPCLIARCCPTIHSGPDDFLRFLACKGLIKFLVLTDSEKYLPEKKKCLNSKLVLQTTKASFQIYPRKLSKNHPLSSFSAFFSLQKLLLTKLCSEWLPLKRAI